jgi:hypothetical protein
MMKKNISLQSLFDEWLNMSTSKVLNKEIMKMIDKEYCACAKDVKMTLEHWKCTNGNLM